MSDFDALCQYMVDGESEAMEDQLEQEPREGTFLEQLEEDMEFHDFEFNRVFEAHNKGCGLHELMLTDNKTAGHQFCPKRNTAESEFQDVADLHQFGYTSDSTLRSSYVGIKVGLVLDSMDLDPCVVPKVSHKDSMDLDEECPPENSSGTNIVVGHVMDLKHPATIAPGQPKFLAHAYFRQLVNPSKGILVALDNLTPLEAYRSESVEEFDLPDLRFWSDVAFLQWKSQAAKDSGLKYVLRYNVTNFMTNFVVEAINGANCCKTLPWPGTDYDVASEEGKTLLGTPNGSSTAYMLVQHKEQLGHKTVDKITVFEHKRELMLLFHIVDVEV
jgi:hypothetical protein